MRTQLLLAIAALAMMAPSAVAVHGSPYTAYGVAILDGNTYDAVVEWTGYWNPYGPSQSFIVTITSQTGEVLVNDHTFPGTWSSPCLCYGNTEVFFPYRAWDTGTQGQLFDIKGIQTLQISTANQFMVYVGHYQLYQLVLVVDDYHG